MPLFIPTKQTNQSLDAFTRAYLEAVEFTECNCDNPELGINILDSPRLNCHIFPKSKKRKTPVTQIIGIVCKDAIVFAAESETTRDNLKQHGTEKISVVNFKNGYALIAEAGAASWSNSAVYAFKRKAENTLIVDDSTISNTAKEAVLEIRNHMTGLHPNASPTDWENFFFQTQNNFELTLGYYFNGKPFIFKLYPIQAYPIPMNGEFETSGIGGDLAHYLLKDFSFKEIQAHPSTLIAAYVLKEIKGSIQYCGGGTSIAVVSAGKKPEKIARSEIISMELQIGEMIAVEKSHRLQKLSQIVNSTSMQYQAGDYDNEGGKQA